MRTNRLRPALYFVVVPFLLRTCLTIWTKQLYAFSIAAGYDSAMAQLFSLRRSAFVALSALLFFPLYEYTTGQGVPWSVERVRELVLFVALYTALTQANGYIVSQKHMLRPNTSAFKFRFTMTVLLNFVFYYAISAIAAFFLPRFFAEQTQCRPFASRMRDLDMRSCALAPNAFRFAEAVSEHCFYLGTSAALFRVAFPLLFGWADASILEEVRRVSGLGAFTGWKPTAASDSSNFEGLLACPASTAHRNANIRRWMFISIMEVAAIQVIAFAAFHVSGLLCPQVLALISGLLLAARGNFFSVWGFIFVEFVLFIVACGIEDVVPLSSAGVSLAALRRPIEAAQYMILFLTIAGVAQPFQTLESAEEILQMFADTGVLPRNFPQHFTDIVLHRHAHREKGESSESTPRPPRPSRARFPQNRMLRHLNAKYLSILEEIAAPQADLTECVKTINKTFRKRTGASISLCSYIPETLPQNVFGTLDFEGQSPMISSQWLRGDISHGSSLAMMSQKGYTHRPKAKAFENIGFSGYASERLMQELRASLNNSVLPVLEDYFVHGFNTLEVIWASSTTPHQRSVSVAFQGETTTIPTSPTSPYQELAIPDTVLMESRQKFPVEGHSMLPITVELPSHLAQVGMRSAVTFLVQPPLSKSVTAFTLIFSKRNVTLAEPVREFIRSVLRLFAFSVKNHFDERKIRGTIETRKKNIKGLWMQLSFFLERMTELEALSDGITFPPSREVRAVREMYEYLLRSSLFEVEQLVRRSANPPTLYCDTFVFSIDRVAEHLANYVRIFCEANELRTGLYISSKVPFNLAGRLSALLRVLETVITAVYKNCDELAIVVRPSDPIHAIQPAVKAAPREGAQFGGKAPGGKRMTIGDQDKARRLQTTHFENITQVSAVRPDQHEKLAWITIRIETTREAALPGPSTAPRWKTVASSPRPPLAPKKMRAGMSDSGVDPVTSVRSISIASPVEIVRQSFADDMNVSDRTASTSSDVQRRKRRRAQSFPSRDQVPTLLRQNRVIRRLLLVLHGVFNLETNADGLVVAISVPLTVPTRPFPSPGLPRHLHYFAPLSRRAEAALQTSPDQFPPGSIILLGTTSSLEAAVVKELLEEWRFLVTWLSTPDDVASFLESEKNIEMFFVEKDFLPQISESVTRLSNFFAISDTIPEPTDVTKTIMRPIKRSSLFRCVDICARRRRAQGAQNPK
eukprot:gnl/Chilomastix_cuspidata/1230.p1 GENE.gnl/Chilomastix_cuspidata/1230~~gnl/Chilomastix_cuspidata/1230.p1  ORF type:complete len:1204 (-),score=362.76 gnl/Chilomastix_cuspidata/1230:1158-4769(-)